MLTPKQIADYYVISPQEAYESARWQEDRYATSPRVTWCNKTLTENVTPLIAGELCGVLAYAGDGKTAMGLAQAYHTAKELIRQKKDLTHRVIYFTWDQPSEVLEMNLERMVRWDRAARRSVPVAAIEYTKAERIALPLWFAGKSAKKNIELARADKPIRIPELTVERIGDVLDFICEKGQIEIALLVADYAQRIKMLKTQQRTETVLLVAELLGDFVTTRNVPAMLLMQSGRGVKERADKTPHINDIQDSSGLEKVLDKGWAQWVPSNSEKEGTPIHVGDKVMSTERGLVKCNKFKDRTGPANIDFAFPFNFETLQIGDYQQ